MRNPPVLLDGRRLADTICKDLAHKVDSFQRSTIESWQNASVPRLTTILIGNNLCSKKYVQMKTAAGRRIGMSVVNIQLPEDIAADDVLERIAQQNALPSVHGILLQHPVPDRLRHRERDFFDAIHPLKDVDGLTSHSAGRLSTGAYGYQPATPKGIIRLLDAYNIPIGGKFVTIVGASNILGKPLSQLFLHQGSTVTLCHKESRPEDIRRSCLHSDIVVGACGVPHFIQPDWIREGAILIDAGYSPDKRGDIDPQAYVKSSYYTPTPGGVGPMTVVTLLSQTVEAAFRSRYDRDRGRYFYRT